MTVGTTDALDHNREYNAQTRAWVVVLDDPTGSQSAHDATPLVEPDPSNCFGPRETTN